MPYQSRPLPPAADLWERYSFNPLTGELFSRKRPSSGKALGRNRDGYIRLHLKWCGVESGVHRIVWKWVHGSDPIDTIDHINRQRADNRVWNLREGDPRLQSRNHANCVLTVESVAVIKAKLAAGESQSDLGRQYGVTNKSIHEIAKGRNWPEVLPNSSPTPVIRGPLSDGCETVQGVASSIA